jgi:4-methyl-5(b-hydroxyethyl)-thiazole monophosphate biosynthesis
LDRAVIVPIADGSEELEAVCIIDVLRRAGAQVTVASVSGLQIVGSRGVKLMADRLVAECVNDAYDLVVLPGGMPGSEHLRDSKAVIHLLKQQAEEEKLYGALCAAPAIVLHHHGLIDGRRVACHPEFRHLITNAEVISGAVAVDGNVITGRGAGVAVEFSLTLVEYLFDREKASEVAEGMVFVGEWREG